MTITRIPQQALQTENIQYLTSQSWVSGVNTYDYRQGPVFYHSNTPTASWTVDIVNVPTLYLNGQANAYNNYGGLVVEFKVCAQLSTTVYYPNQLRIEGAGQTLFVQSGTGTASKFNVWTFQLFRVGTTWIKSCLKTHEAY